jgi:hypothetical protein
MEERVEVLLLVQLEHKAEKREVQKLKELRELKTSRAANSALFFLCKNGFICRKPIGCI